MIRFRPSWAGFLRLHISSGHLPSSLLASCASSRSLGPRSSLSTANRVLGFSISTRPDHSRPPLFARRASLDIPCDEPHASPSGLLRAELRTAPRRYGRRKARSSKIRSRRHHARRGSALVGQGHLVSVHDTPPPPPPLAPCFSCTGRAGSSFEPCFRDMSLHLHREATLSLSQLQTSLEYSAKRRD